MLNLSARLEEMESAARHLRDIPQVVVSPPRTAMEHCCVHVVIMLCFLTHFCCLFVCCVPGLKGRRENVESTGKQIGESISMRNVQ